MECFYSRFDTAALGRVNTMTQGLYRGKSFVGEIGKNGGLEEEREDAFSLKERRCVNSRHQSC